MKKLTHRGAWTWKGQYDCLLLPCGSFHFPTGILVSCLLLCTCHLSGDSKPWEDDHSPEQTQLSGPEEQIPSPSAFLPDPILWVSISRAASSPHTPVALCFAALWADLSPSSVLKEDLLMKAHHSWAYWLFTFLHRRSGQEGDGTLTWVSSQPSWQVVCLCALIAHGLWGRDREGWGTTCSHGEAIIPKQCRPSIVAT